MLIQFLILHSSENFKTTNIFGSLKLKLINQFIKLLSAVNDNYIKCKELFSHQKIKILKSEKKMCDLLNIKIQNLFLENKFANDILINSK